MEKREMLSECPRALKLTYKLLFSGHLVILFLFSLPPQSSFIKQYSWHSEKILKKYRIFFFLKYFRSVFSEMCIIVLTRCTMDAICICVQLWRNCCDTEGKAGWTTEGFVQLTVNATDYHLIFLIFCVCGPALFEGEY